MRLNIFCVFFFFIFFNLIHASSPSIPDDSIKKIEKTIQLETAQIKKLDPLCIAADEEILDLYNERGISYFAIQDYQLALDDFNHILEIAYFNNQMLNPIVGAALWGKALCHACLEKDENFIEDLYFLKYYVSWLGQELCHCDKEKIIPTLNHKNFTILPIVKFANPNEKISAEECRERLRGTAEKLKLFIAPLIKDTAKRAIFITFINGLENQGLYCCKDGSIWTTCVTPLLQKLEKWKLVGIPADPAWD